MEVTEVSIQIPAPAAAGNDRIRAFASIVLGGVIAVRDIRLVELPGGKIFTQMPDRALMDRCPACARRNPITGRFCGHCGARLADRRAPLDNRGRPKLFSGVVFPLDAATRGIIEAAVRGAYREEIAR